MSLKMHLPPATLNDVGAGISEVLNRRLMKYDETIGGVMLSYSNVTLSKDRGAIFNELPNIMFEVNVEAVIFGPRPGCRLLGKVNKISRNHVGMLVGGVFNASVSSDKISKDLQYDAELDTWCDNRPGTNAPGALSLGDNLSFVAERIQSSGGIFCINGKLDDHLNDRSEATLTPGAARALQGEEEGELAQSGRVKKKKKKKKKTQERSGSETDGSTAGEHVGLRVGAAENLAEANEGQQNSREVTIAKQTKSSKRKGEQKDKGVAKKGKRRKA